MTQRTRFVIKVAAFALLCAVFVGAVLTVCITEDAPPQSLTVDINEATAEELQRLDGMTATIAAHIIEYREHFVMFTAMEDLLEVDGITEDLLDAWRPHLTL